MSGDGEAVRQPAGTHLLADLYGVDAGRLADARLLEESLKSAAEQAGATVLGSHFHGFGRGLGVTGVVLLAESHVSIHTWPEFGYAALDIFMCGEAEPLRALEAIQAALQPSAREVCSIARLRT